MLPLVLGSEAVLSRLFTARFGGSVAGCSRKLTLALSQWRSTSIDQSPQDCAKRCIGFEKVRNKVLKLCDMRSDATSTSQLDQTTNQSTVSGGTSNRLSMRSNPGENLFEEIFTRRNFYFAGKCPHVRPDTNAESVGSCVPGHDLFCAQCHALVERGERSMLWR